MGSQLIPSNVAVLISCIAGILITIILSKDVEESESHPQCLAGIASAVACYLLMDLLISVGMIFLIGFLVMKFGPNLFKGAMNGKAQAQQIFQEFKHQQMNPGLGYTPPQPSISIDEILEALEEGDLEAAKEAAHGLNARNN